MDKIIVGLGNPGTRYEGTRHNIGWMVLDRLAERAGVSGRVRARDGSSSVRARIDDLDLLLVKPMTYMNLSGTAVRAVLARERVPLRDLLVVVDDFALPFGRLRIRERGSDGGHNGLRSIIGELGTQAFPRLRVGIGSPERDAIDHVLGVFSADERAHLAEVLDAAADCAVDGVSHGPPRAASLWNGWRLAGEASSDGAEEASSGGAGEALGAKAKGAKTTVAKGTGSGADVSGAEADAPAGTDPLDPPEREEPPARPEPPTPGPDGILRTATGWRRLLRSAGSDPGPDEG